MSPAIFVANLRPLVYPRPQLHSYFPPLPQRIVKVIVDRQQFDFTKGHEHTCIRIQYSVVPDLAFIKTERRIVNQELAYLEMIYLPSYSNFTLPCI